MVKEYLTIAELAKQVDIPNSTCRRYLASFEAFFVVKGGNRLKKYESHAVDVLTRIKNLYDEGLESSEIYNVLMNEFSLVIDGDEQRETNEMSTVLTLATVEDVEEIKELFKQQMDFNWLLMEELKKQGTHITKLFEIIEQDKKLLESNRETLDSIINGSNEAEKEVATAEQQVTQTQQEAKQKGFFARLLFGK
jgi:DNA-binding transcriptional MerR regulator